mmetsp:Transcript_19548/g.61925  ORF Transcript_19548/g.61925 Transcript_19548/m.61925 type:complete len:188 (+) Transcript_19548:1-564(+)
MEWEGACVLFTSFVTMGPLIASAVIVSMEWEGAGEACTQSGLRIYAVVHIPVLLAHLLCSWYVNFIFNRERVGEEGVIKRFWRLLLYDPAMLLYILIVVFNGVWIGYTLIAISVAGIEGCCDAHPALCIIARACWIIEILYAFFAPMLIGSALANECCTAIDEGGIQGVTGTATRRSRRRRGPVAKV